MPVKVNVTSRKYFNQFNNGDDFLSNPGDFTTNLAGGTIEKIKVEQIVEIEWLGEAKASNPWTIDNIAAPTFIERVSGSFKDDDGFSAGDLCDFIEDFTGDPTTPVTVTLTIDTISSDGKRIFITVLTGSFLQKVYQNAGLRGLTPLTALIYGFGLIGNDEPFNIRSKVTDNAQAYYGADIGFDTGGGVRDLGVVALLTLGPYNDWVTGSATAQFVQDVATYTQQFKLVHTFGINPYFIEGELSNLEDNVLPEIYDGLNTLKYVFESDFRVVLSNPNTSKTQRDEDNLGSVAWFDENFNGFDNLYAVKSITYFETAVPANSADGLIVGTKTTAKITIERVGDAFSAAERFGAFISALPPADEYTNKVTDLTENFILDSLYNVEGAGSVASDFIKALSATIVAGDLVVTIEVDYSAAQQIRLTDNSNYLISIQVGDEALTPGNSDRVVLLADVNNYVQNADIPDLMNVTKFNLLPHNLQLGVDVGYTSLTQWNEDGFAADIRFSIDIAKNAAINTIEFALIAHNPVTGESFDLDSFSFDIANAIVSGGIQQLEISTTRGYILAVGDDFNIVLLTTDNKVGDDQFYNLQIGQKISWQDWLENLNADTIFFDATEQNNNLNFKTSNYSGLNDYEIKAVLRANLSGTNTLGQSGLTDYEFLTAENTVFDYDKDGNVPPGWVGTIETFNADNDADLDGKILVGTNTKMKITWVKDGGGASTTPLYVIHRIEKTNQQGYDITELGVLYPTPPDNILIPLVGETELKVSLVAGEIISECLIDGSKIEAGTSYNLSGRLNDDAITASQKVLAPGGIIEKETTDSEIKSLAP